MSYSSRHFLLIAVLGVLLGLGIDHCATEAGASKAPGWGIGESAYRMANALERIADALEKKK